LGAAPSVAISALGLGADNIAAAVNGFSVKERDLKREALSMLKS
jgi:hypothetical protein